jgi:parvulin-like peptidyl-prolyl isomerase
VPRKSINYGKTLKNLEATRLVTMRQIFFKLLREPLIHFLILGAGLFVLYAAVSGSVSTQIDRIVVDETQVMRLAEQFQRTWMRPPTEQELQALAEDYVKEEILYREAQALGLDEDDLVIRRRLRQKMEFLNADLTEPRAPTEAQLLTYFDANQDRFRRPDRFSIQQIYLNPHKHKSNLNRTAAELLERLNTDPTFAADYQAIGDVTLLPAKLDGVTRREVANTFGPGFAKDLENIPVGRWSGPYESSYGLHLICITEHKSGGLPAMQEIRPVLEREWRTERSKAANERFYQALRERYEVEIRLPADSASKTLAVR